jgi:hypothetical protein
MTNPLILKGSVSPPPRLAAPFMNAGNALFHRVSASLKLQQRAERITKRATALVENPWNLFSPRSRSWGML